MRVDGQEPPEAGCYIYGLFLEGGKGLWVCARLHVNDCACEEGQKDTATDGPAEQDGLPINVSTLESTDVPEARTDKGDS